MHFSKNIISNNKKLKKIKKKLKKHIKIYNKKIYFI